MSENYCCVSESLCWLVRWTSSQVASLSSVWSGSKGQSGLPASLWTVFHVVSNLPANPAAAIVGRQLAVCQHLGVKEVVLWQKTRKGFGLQFLHLSKVFKRISEVFSISASKIPPDLRLHCQGPGRRAFQTVFSHL